MEVKTEVEKRNTEQERQQKQESFHVLAVDDSLIDRKLLEKLLKISSYQVTCVDSGDKALEYLGLIDNLQTNASTPSMEEGSRVNLIMTDYCMPGMTGYDLLKRLKGSSWKDVPVVVMSSEDVPSRVAMCLEGGAEDFLLKPVRLTDLEKLQPHLLKPVNRSCANNDNGGDGDKINNNGNEMNNENNVYKSSSSGNNETGSAAALGSKRKAMSPLEAPDRRPKMKETVALLV